MRDAHRPPLRPATSTAAALALLAALAAPAAADLASDIELAIRSPELVGATVSVSVRDADSGSEIAAVNAAEPMLPASNMKLFTTGAALHILGSEFAFRTTLLRDGDRLLVVGGGDPAFGDPDLLPLMQVGGAEGIDAEAFLGIWVNAVRQSDLGAVREIVVDDRIFDRAAVHESWPADQFERAYCAQVSGLNFHLNVLHVYPRPSGGTRPDVSTLIPHAPWLQVDNRATCEAAGQSASSAWISRRLGTNDLTIHGTVRHVFRKPITVTLHDPASFFAAILAHRLEAAGIDVGGHRLAAPDDPPSAGDLAAPVVSTPISTVVTRANRDSENLYAEALLKRLGHEISREPGSWTNGTAVVRHVVYERLGPGATERLVVADGSGLSRENRVSASTTTAWLDSFHRDEALGPVFVESLAVAGGSGTLRERFAQVELHGAAVHAKSGYINGVSCLSGYVTAPGGKRRSFAVLANGLRPEDVLRAKRLQERIVSLIAGDLVPSGVTLGSD